MTIQEICDVLRVELYNTGFEYGFFLNGIKYKPDIQKGFDNEYYQLSQTIYRVQNPEATLKEKIGTCVDAVVVMKYILDKLGVPFKIWLLHNKAKNKLHTILTFEADNKIVYLELTPQFGKAWYGKEIVYSSEQEFFGEQAKSGWDVDDVTNLIEVGEQPSFLL